MINSILLCNELKKKMQKSLPLIELSHYNMMNTLPGLTQPDLREEVD